MKTAAIFADCRVSYVDKHLTDVDDNLQKIYQIDKRMVFGFSGPLSGAYQVMEAIRKNINAYSKPPVAINLYKDVERWIRHEYQQIKEPRDRKNLSFILATVEPSRESLSKWRTSDGKTIPKPKWFGPDPPEMKVVALKPKKSNSNQLYKEQKGMCKTIGVSKEVEDAIQDVMQKWFGFSFKQPDQQATVIADVLMATLMEKQVDTVGGLFQVALLSTNGVQWLTYGTGSVTLDIVDGYYVQRDNTTGKVIPLRPIWEWWEEWHDEVNQRLGKVGVFEDFDLRKTIESSKDEGKDEKAI